MNDDEGLDLHVRALTAAKNGDLEGAASAFAEAQHWESANGYARGALHTAHEMALVTNFGGDLERLAAYYRETLATLKRLRNREGMALCLRSYGEIAYIRGQLAECAKAWELSASLFAALQLAEERQIVAWLGRAGSR